MLRRSQFAIASLSLASVLGGDALSPGASSLAATELDELVRRSADGNAALMRGDAKTWTTLLPISSDFTLMSPMGGQPGRAPYSGEQLQEIARFFKNGTFDQQLVQAYATRDMVVLATIERAEVEVGDLPRQEWLLRVTAVFRRAGSKCELLHRHSDPLVKGITLMQSAALTRGDADEAISSKDP